MPASGTTLLIYPYYHSYECSSMAPLQTCWRYLLVEAPRHDDVIKWKHFPRHWPFVRGIHRSPLNSPHKGQWRGALMFSLICPWIIGWVNNRETGDFRRHCAHYDVTVMTCSDPVDTPKGFRSRLRVGIAKPMPTSVYGHGAKHPISMHITTEQAVRWHYLGKRWLIVDKLF